MLDNLQELVYRTDRLIDAASLEPLPYFEILSALVISTSVSLLEDTCTGHPGSVSLSHRRSNSCCYRLFLIFLSPFLDVIWMSVSAFF